MVQQSSDPSELLNSVIGARDEQQTPLTEQGRLTQFIMSLAKELSAAAHEMNASSVRILSPRLLPLNPDPDDATQQQSILYASVIGIVTCTKTYGKPSNFECVCLSTLSRLCPPGHRTYSRSTINRHCPYDVY
jgi:hypothetical protein